MKEATKVEMRNDKINPLRILLVTQEDPFYLPLFFEHFLTGTSERVLAIAILPSLNTGLLTVAKQLYNLYGLKDFLFFSLSYIKARFLDMASSFLPFKKLYSIKAVARKHNIPVLKPRDINSKDFLKYLQNSLKPDLIVSISASQIFQDELLKIPPLGCINLHAGPLPRYAGMMPSFWVLAKGEKETAVTLHYMTARLDKGEILMQWPLPISSSDTLHSLVIKNKEVGYKMLLQLLEDLRGGKVIPKPNDPQQRSYFHFPGKEDAREFRNRGRNFR